MKNKIIIVSACLLGLSTKYSGSNNFSKDVLELANHYIFAPLCPEQLGGLPTPRPPAEIIGNKVIDINGVNVTENFLRGAEEALKFTRIYDIKLAILKDGSPSCGVHCIYDGTFSGSKVDGIGITARLFRKNGIKVFSENDLEEFLYEEK
ncbi:MAG: DUF523 domain-containing protein [Nitrospiraceae bacterium]|nr:DUF523 domain-containing protein [Nitrospiraceae bacterium]